MWIGYLPFALVVLITAVVLTVRSVRARRKVNEKMDQLENELIKIRGKAYAKHTGPEKDKNHKT
jgi:hypothetical protein